VKLKLLTYYTEYQHNDKIIILFQQTLFTSIILLSIAYRCEKEPIVNPAKDIIGKWDWIYTFYTMPLSDSNPLTPEYLGIREILVFNPDHSWYKTLNNIKVDSGTFLTGHGHYTPYPGAGTFIYDSISYYQNGIPIYGGVDYYNIYHDTLHFTPYYGAKFSSYTLPNNGAKYWKKLIE